MTSTTHITVERRIKARPDTVFSFFTEPGLWLSWMGCSGEFDPRPGGSYRMNVTGTAAASGHFVEITPYRRIVFTFGWEADGDPVPPGTSTVEITLEPDGEDTIVRLTHRDLPGQARAPHQAGWNHYLGRLAARAEGRDPGPDTWMQDG
jgi:uncharacterized protein YndB with AHSA1/START domain